MPWFFLIAIALMYWKPLDHVGRIPVVTDVYCIVKISLLQEMDHQTHNRVPVASAPRECENLDSAKLPKVIWTSLEFW